MNDEFLTKIHRVPRAEFADALYKSISRQTNPRFAHTLAKKITFRNAMIALAFLFFIAACVYAVSERRWDKVGNIWIYVQRTYKVDYSPPPNFTPPAEPETQIPDFECVSVKEAKEILRFDLRVPAWAPEGFTFDNRMCSIDRTSDFAYLNWETADKYKGIHIELSNLRGFNISTQKYEIGPAGIWQPVAPDSYEEVQVHGQPAVLVRGDWEEPWATEEMLSQKYEFKWDRKRTMQLYWVDGEVFYHLYTRAELSPEDLIKMAESAR